MVAFGIAFGMDYIPLLILSADPPQGFLFFHSIDEACLLHAADRP
jgi:hypothetical protein